MDNDELVNKFMIQRQSNMLSVVEIKQRCFV